MKKLVLYTFWLLTAVEIWAQTSPGMGDFKLTLPDHPGQLRWRADGFKIVQSSAKQNRSEIGIRGNKAGGELSFLGFLFLVPEQAPLTSSKCRDGALEQLKKGSPTLKILATSELTRPSSLPIELASYSLQGRDGKSGYSMRGFLASGDICGDLEFYSAAPINADDPALGKIWASFQFDPGYTPQFDDVSTYAEILYQSQMYQAAAPIFEEALTKLGKDSSRDQVVWTRVTTDQAGMAYGLAGNISKARAIFEAAIARDPEYPLYYYNLACADAAEKNLVDARAHLKQAFARRKNLVPGEVMPDPSKDDSFLPYREDKDFWAFIQSLR